MCGIRKGLVSDLWLWQTLGDMVCVQSFLQKIIRAYWSKRRVEINDSFQNHPNLHFRDMALPQSVLYCISTMQRFKSAYKGWVYPRGRAAAVSSRLCCVLYIKAFQSCRHDPLLKSGTMSAITKAMKKVVRCLWVSLWASCWCSLTLYKKLKMAVWPTFNVWFHDFYKY